ncbi:putative olfactory receptor 2W6 [Alligator mississippiensis]|nr:putative olfactory receptor 2W6 [Alligator mississippiensis]
MAFDRYVAICRPLHYLLIMNRRICGIMIMSCWAGGFFGAAVLTGVTFSFPYCGPNHVEHFFCEQPAVLQLVCVDTSSVEVLIFALSVVVLMLPFFFILASYIAIAGAVLSMSSAAGRHRAFSTCSSHLTVVTMFYSTISFTYLRPQATQSREQEKKVAIFYSIVSPMLNPVIYSFRNKDVKGALAKVLGKN